MRKARIWRAFLIKKRKFSDTALPGWRRSADRTGLQANSLITGNFTGNFAISRAQCPLSPQVTAGLQHLLAQFPKLLIRENI
jgi:hypothetical protein